MNLFNTAEVIMLISIVAAEVVVAAVVRTVVAVVQSWLFKL